MNKWLIGIVTFTLFTFNNSSWACHHRHTHDGMTNITTHAASHPRCHHAVCPHHQADPQNMPSVKTSPCPYEASSMGAPSSLPGQDFTNQNLSMVQLNGQMLSGAHFSRAILTGAHFKSADLSNADFTGAKLLGADFRNANLQGAHFSSADLTDSRLNGANLTGATYNVHTFFPFHFVPQAYGMIQIPLDN